MRVTVRKWGNSAAVRIPRGILEAAGLSLDDSVEIREEGGSIVIERARTRYRLEDLLKAHQSLAPAADAGDKAWMEDAPVGRELL